MDYTTLAMLCSWDSLALRLFAAAALAAGLHALRQLHRARAASSPEDREEAEKPLLTRVAGSTEGDESGSAAGQALDVLTNGPPLPVAGAPADQAREQEEEQEQQAAQQAGGAEQLVEAQPWQAAVPAAPAAAALEGAAGSGTGSAGALGAHTPPGPPLEQQGLQQQLADLAAPPGPASSAAEPAEAAPQQAAPARDAADVHPAALGSPFVPPLLVSAAPPALGDGEGAGQSAIPLFSSFVPTPPASAEAAPVGGSASDEPAPAGPPAAAAAPAVSPRSDAGSSTGPGSDASPAAAWGAPRGHRRQRSLLSEGLGGSAASSPSPEEQAAQLELEQELLQGRRKMRAEMAATEAAPAAPAATAAAQAASGGAPAARPDLWVELPFEPDPEPAAGSALQGAAPGVPAPSPQFQTPPQLPHQEPPSPGGRRNPPAFHQQQAAEEEAAAAAAAAAAAWGSQQAVLAAHAAAPTPDSVAAALQRAVQLAASGTAPRGYAGVSAAASQAAGHAAAPLSAAPTVAAPAGFPTVNLRGAPVSGTFRSGAQGRHAPAPLSSLYGPPPGGLAGPPLGAGDSAWGESGFSMLMERSLTSRSERHLPRLSEEVEGVRSSADVDVPLACKLVVVAGPCSPSSYVSTEDVLEIVIGRNVGSTMQLNDGEISGQHASVRWSSVDKCWKVADLGSLNGTLLNGEPISVAGRKRGRDYRLSTDDILQLGSFTQLKVSTFPRDLLDPQQSRCGSLPVGSMPKSLTMPKHRIPSFSSLLSPKITNTPSKKATVAAASDELRLECCIVSRTGRDHQRKGQTCEDVACAECPLHGSEAALGSEHPAALFCVFDGHCGRGAADAASVALPDEVSSRLQGVRGELLAARGADAMLRDAFLATDRAISAEEGCTATAVLMWRDDEGAVCLQAANVGDSAALFIDPEAGRAVELTEDHRLTNPRERQRLQGMGIQLASNARRLYGLNLCRGLGDKFLKDEDLGLSAEPFVSPVLRLSQEQGGILLIASDGLWDVADADAVTAAICQADREKDGSVLESTNAVIAHALKQRTKDDVTALVVRVWPASEWVLRSPTKNLDDGQAAAFVS